MDDKLTLFYNSLTANPAITGLPEDIGTFKTALSDPARSEVFYNSLKANPNIKGLPDNYKDFLSGLSIKAGGVTPQQPRQPFFEGLGKKGGVSLLSLGEMVTEIPQAVEAVANIPMNIFAGAMIKKAERKGELDKETADFLREEQLYPKANFGQILPSVPGQESMGQALADSKLNEWFESNAEKLNETITRYDQTATQYLKNKQFGNALGAISYGVAESIAPTLAAMLVPGGAAALGLGVGAQKYDEVKDREDMSEAMKLADSATSGIFEWLFEKLGSAEVAKYLKSYYNKVGGKGLQQAFGSQTMQNLIGKAYKKLGLWFAPVHEGVSEFATQIGQDLASKLSGESPDLTFQDIKANAIEAFLIGTGMGGFFSSTTALAKKVKDTVSPPSPLDTDTEPGAIGPLQVPRTQQEVEQIINKYGRNIKFGETPLEEDPDPMVSFAQTKLGQKVVLKQEAGLSGDKFFIAIDTETKQPLFIKPADIVERKDVPYQQWFNDEMNNYLIVKDEADNVTAQIEAPVKEGQDITLKDRNFFVSQVTAGGVTLNEIDEKGNITEGELIVPPEDYEKVFGVPAVDNGGVSQENVTEQGLQPQNTVTEQGQSTSVDNTLIPQLPVNKKGEIEYDQITEPDMYAQGLAQEFGEDAPAILEDLIAEQEAALEKAKKTGNAIEKARKIKAISAELKKLEGAKEILTPTATATQGTLDAKSASPVAEQPEPTEQATVQDLARPEEDEYAGLTNQERNGVMFAKALPGILNKALEQQKPFRDAFLARVRPGLTYEQYSKLPEEERAELQELWVNSPEFAEMHAEPDETAPVEAEMQEAGEMEQVNSEKEPTESELKEIVKKWDDEWDKQYKRLGRLKNVSIDKITENTNNQLGISLDYYSKYIVPNLKKPTDDSPEDEQALINKQQREEADDLRRRINLRSPKELNKPAFNKLIEDKTVSLASDKGGYDILPSVYIRFGEPIIDKEGKPVESTNYYTGKKEKGISVYRAFFDKKTGKYILASGGEDYLSTQDSFTDTKRKIYLVEGEVEDYGSDGENVLRKDSFKQVSEINPDDVVTEQDRNLTFAGNELSETPSWAETDVVDVRELIATEYLKAKANNTNKELIDSVDELLGSNKTQSPEVQLIKANDQVDTRPTEAQKEAENYKMGHVRIKGLDITIQNPVGSVRKGTDKKGNEWAIILNNTYGYIRGTVSPEGKGKKKDQVDVFLGDNLDSEAVYVIDQIDPETGKFDEPKVMIGFNSLQDAKDNYLANYEPGWKGLGDITKMSMSDFKKWLGDGTRTRKPVAPELIKEETFPKSRLSPIDKMLNMTGQEIVNEWEELVYPIDLLSEQNKKQALELQKQKKATRKKDERAKFDEKIKQLQNETHKAYDDLENEYGERNEQLWQWIKSEIKRRGISIPEETEDEDYYFFSELMNDIFERPGREVTWYMKFKDVFDEQFNGWVENKIFASLKPKAEEKAKPEEAIEPKAEQAPAAPETRDLTGFRKGDLVKNVQTEMIYEIIAPAKDGKVHLKVKGGKEIIKFSAKRKLFVPVQKEIKVKGKKRGPITFKPDSPYGRALNKTPESFEEAVMQFFIGGGRVRTDDFRRYLGIDPIKEKYLWAIKNEGTHLDVLHETMPNSFGIEEQGSMAEINAIGDVLRNYHTKNEMVEELLRRMDQPLEQELAPEDVIEQMEDATEENVEDTAPETVDNLLAQILASKETMSIFTSGRHFDGNGNIDWAKLKDLAEKDPDHFTFFPFSLNETEFENFKALLNDTERQRELSRKVEGSYPIESRGEGDILRPGTPGDEERDGGTAEEPAEEPVGEPPGPEVREYQYKMLARPFDIGTFPKEGFVKSDNDPQGGYQILTYNRKLTPEEQRKWEFLPLTEIAEIKGKEFIDKDGYYSRISLSWFGGGKYAKVSMYDAEGNLVDEISGMKASEILQNVNEGYWTEKEETPEEKPEFVGEYLKKHPGAFLKASDGSLDFGHIPAETGLKEAPIRLTEGNDSHGLLHIIEQHGEEIKKAGYKNVPSFVEDVAKNYTVIRAGTVYHDKPTFLLELVDKQNRTLIVELSRNGEYWNVNSAGIFRKGYSKNKKVVWSIPALGIKQSATTDDIAYPPENKSGTGKVSGNSPQTTSLEDKDTKKEETSQAPEQKKTEFAGEYLEKKPEEKVLKEEKPKGPDYKTPKGQAELLKYLIDAENNLASNQKEIASLKDSESLSPVKRKELKQRELLQEQNQKRINDLKEQIDNDILPPEKQNEIRKLIQETNTRNAVVANRILRLQDERDTKEKSLQKRNTLLGDSKIEQEKQAGMQDLFGMEEVFQPKAENLQAALKPFNDGIKKAEEEIDRNNQLLDEKIDLVLKGTQEAIDWGTPPAEADEKAEAPKTDSPDELKMEIVEVSKPEQKIEDFGEHISGAKKEIRGQLKKHLETTDEDLLNNSISKVLPPVDYKNLVDSGMATPQESAFLAYLRMGIGPKPKSQYKQAGWLRKVNAYKDALRWIIEKEEFMAAHEGQSMMELLEKSADVYLVKRMKDYISTLVELGFPNDVTSLKDYEIKHFEGGVRIDGRGGKIERPARWTIVKGHYIVQDFETREQAIAGLKYILTTENEAPRKVKFDVWKENGKKGLFVGKKVGPRKYITLASGFDKISEVRKYIENHQEELEKMLEQKKIIPYERPEERGPRIGKDYRKGENVTPELFSQTFGFRGVQFGNYVEQLKRQEDLNEAYDALMDLSDILGLPPMALSLSGQLGIAFGARGTGGKQAPSAHYEPNEIVINLTKNAGAGSLAHEWFHAVDNYFSRSRGEKFGYLIERPFQLINKDGTKSDLVRPEVIEAFKNVVNTIHGSGLRQRSKELDKRRTKDYWSQPIEMAARSFEAYIKAKLSEREVKNDYLVSFKDIVDYIIAAGGEEGVYPYPTKEESEKIFGAFDNLFSAIQTKEEDGRVVMYRTSRAGGTANNKPFQEFSDRDAIRAEKAAVKEFGTTDDWREVGYITFNGNKLDFSGKNDGGMPGERGYDHRQVNSALDGIDLGKYETDKYWQDSASNGMYAFLDMGNIRVSSSFGGLAMTMMPTTEQFREIRNFIRHYNGMISLDLNDTGVEYNKWTDEEQIINDIKRFYDEGIVPLPDFSAFRSTQPQGEALLESVIGGETPNYDRYLTDKITELGESFNTPITVVKNKYELPVRLQRQMQRDKVWNSRVTGLYDRQTGTIYVLLDDIKALGADKAMEEVTKTVLHEIVAHKGLPELLGEEEYERFLDDLYWDIPQDDRALLMYEYSTDDKKTITEEYLGMMAEDNINPNLFQRVLAKIRQLLRRLFRVSYSENDIRDMLRRSQENLRRPQTKDYEFAGEYLEDSVKEERSGSFRARQRVKQSLLEQAAEAYSEKEKKRQLGETMQGIREYFQDLNLPIRRFEEEVIKRGGQQDNQSKPYRDLNLSFGRHEKLYNDFFDEKMKPVLDAIAQLKKAGVPGENILPYIICKHAIERNAVMRGHELREWVDSNKNATFEDIEAEKEALKDKDYSGVMSFDKEGSYTNPDELARDVVREFESQVKNKKLIDNLWSTTKAATNTILDAWEDGLQISPERKKEYQEQYRFYVPLRGWREGAAKDLVYTKGEGFSKSLRHAEGRKSLADNPLAYIQQVAFQAIAEQIDNEVKTSMSNLIIRNLKNNEIHELATIKKLYFVKVHLPDGTHEWEPTTDRPSPELFESGEATQKIYRAHERLRAPRQAKEHEVYVHRPGGDLVMIFKGKNLPVAQALNKQNYIYRNVFGHYDARDINKAFMLMGHINNMLKAAYTSWNVVFPFTNFMRDFQEASITQAIKQGTGLKVIRNYKHAFPAIARHIAGRSDLKKPIDRELDDFYRLGGATGYTHLKTPEEIEKDINNEIKRMVREGSIRGDMQNSAITFLNAVEAWNRIFEDATRFAVYRASLAAGNTKEDAAIDAKEASVNFNRKGKGSKAWDAWFAFFNVALQSMQKNFSLAKHHTGRFSAVALSFITVGFIEAMMNALFDDDDDSSYYNINPYMRHNYLVIPNVISLIKGEGKGDKYLSIPLPQFWRGFKSMGAIGFDIATKRTKVIDGIMDALGNFGSSLLPVDIGGFWKSGEFSFAPIMPTVIKPIVEVAENKNYMGYAIMNEPFTRDQKKILANAGLGKKNVSPAAKFFTDMLFRWGGGDTKYKYYYDEAKGRHRKVPGVLDINPSAIEHLFKGYTGGTGAVFSDMITTISQAFDPDEEIDFRNTPFVNRFIRKTPEAKWNIIKEYYDLRDDSKVTNLLSKEYWKSGSYDKAMSILGDEYSMKYIQTIKHYESALDDAAKAMDYDTIEGSDLTIELMRQCIIDIRDLKEEHGKK